MGGITLLFHFLISSSSIFIISSSSDTITTTQFIADNTTIVSPGGTFELGFFSPGSSKTRYIGIWYKKIPIQTVVWVANRDTPITDSSGVLKLISSGILVLINTTNNSIIWSSNVSGSGKNPIAQLLDSGNFVVRDAGDQNPEAFLWQSFDHPSDTLLPGMKLGKNFRTGHEHHLSSWRSSEDPAPGEYTYQSDPTGYPQNVLRKGSVDVFRSGPWNGMGFSGSPSLKRNHIYEFRLVFNEDEVFYSYKLLDSSIISRFMVNQSGYAQRWTWVDRTRSWALYLSLPTDICDNYGFCGAHGSCNVANSPPCECLDRFVPKDPKKWEMADWSSEGCVRRTQLDCRNGDGFLRYSRVKFPDTRSSWFNRSIDIRECEAVCSRNCSCMAYANLDVRDGGSGCLLWFGDLIDFRFVAESDQYIFIRMASSELDSAIQPVGSKGKSNKKRDVIILCFILSMGVLLLGLIFTLYIWKKKKKKKKKSIPMQREAPVRLGNNYEQSYTNNNQNEDFELPLFDLATIACATDDFSINNKLGEGGFGPVYKGMLEDGQEIAVKRLSENSFQGLEEFKNEVMCIAKLQHRNLVRLLGCCIEGVEKMLIYEYMPNKSLDFYIFGGTQRAMLNWPKRYNIINGIARGIMYLHQDSRLRIIHRDLKASNILLDSDMNPKISDFGMARSFGGNEIEAETRRVVGTYGYMSPEYTVDGIFSVKSDVFSFGVLVLEILSGKKNRGFFHPDHNHNLLGHAWLLHKEGRQMEMIDESMDGSCCLSEVLRCIHVSLLCVQQSPENRPNISSVVLMLGSEGSLPEPKHPGFFFTKRNKFEADFPSSRQAHSSENYMSITQLEPR